MKKVIASVPISSKIGWPSAMDEEAIKKFQNTLLTRRDARNAVPLSETLTLMGAGVEETRMREGKRGAAAVSSICVTTQKKLFKECNVVKLKPQILTDARLKACRFCGLWRGNPLACSAFASYQCEPMTSRLASALGSGSNPASGSVRHNVNIRHNTLSIHHV
jgi:hypothetical protein